MEHERRRKSFKQWIIDNVPAVIVFIGFIVTLIIWGSKIPTMSAAIKDNDCRIIQLEKTNAVFIEKLDNVDKTLIRIERLLEKNNDRR